MIIFVYDGTPVGLANAVAAALDPGGDAAARAGTTIVAADVFRPNLFDEARRVETDYPAALAFWRDLAARLPADLWTEVFTCFFAGEPGIEDPLLRYLRLLLSTGGRAAADWTDETVRFIRRLSGRISHEVHRLHGFIRFERLPNGLYYSRVTPDHPILPLLAPHFAARFADQQWLIHDLKRNTGVYYDGGHWYFLPEVAFPTAPDQTLAAMDPLEHLCQEIWREYYKTIAIKERSNPRRQKQRLPVRYWGNMTEMRNQPPPAPPIGQGLTGQCAAEDRPPYSAGPATEPPPDERIE